MNEDKVQAVIDAWNDPGPQPAYHQSFKRWLREQWPVLARSLDNLTTTTIEGYNYNHGNHMERTTTTCEAP